MYADIFIFFYSKDVVMSEESYETDRQNQSILMSAYWIAKWVTFGQPVCAGPEENYFQDIYRDSQGKRKGPAYISKAMGKNN